MFIFILLCTALVKISSSQYNSNYLLVVTDKKVYCEGENVSFTIMTNIPPETNFSMCLLINNITYSFNDTSVVNHTVGGLSKGNYTALVTFLTDGLNLKNSTEFSIKGLEIYGKTGYRVNKTIWFKIKGCPNTTYEVRMTGPVVETHVINTDENGLGLFKTVVNVQGNYTVEIGNRRFRIDVLPEEEKKECVLFLSISNETFLMDKDVDISVRGNCKTNYTLIVTSPLGNDVFEIHGKLGMNESNVYSLRLSAPGTYRVNLLYPEGSVEKVLRVLESRKNFSIILNKRMFSPSEPVELNISGPVNTSFTLLLKKKGCSLIYNMSMGDSTSLPFVTTLQPGNYSVYVVIKGKVLAKDYFEVYQERANLIKALPIETIQKPAALDERVTWVRKLLVTNLQNESFSINFSSFIPEGGKVLKVEDGSHNPVSANKILPGEQKTFYVYYTTKAPYISEEHVEIDQDTWKKSIVVVNDFPVPYVNVTLVITLPKDLREIMILDKSSGKEVDDYTVYEDEDGNKVSWVVDELTRSEYLIEGLINIPPPSSRICISHLPFIVPYDNTQYYLDTNLSSSTDGIILFSKKNVTIDCKGKTIQGSEKGFGVMVKNSSAITIKNCVIKKFEVGIIALNTSMSTLSNNRVSANEEGILLISSNNNLLLTNRAVDNLNQGMLLYSSFNNTVLGNIVKSRFRVSTLQKLESLTKISKYYQ